MGLLVRLRDLAQDAATLGRTRDGDGGNVRQPCLHTARSEAAKRAEAPLPEEPISTALALDLLREFEAGPARTWPLIILRHGSAGEKRQWEGADELRPLDDRGRAEDVSQEVFFRLLRRPQAVSASRQST